MCRLSMTNSWLLLVYLVSVLLVVVISKLYPSKIYGREFSFMQWGQCSELYTLNILTRLHTMLQALTLSK